MSATEPGRTAYEARYEEQIGPGKTMGPWADLRKDARAIWRRVEEACCNLVRQDGQVLRRYDLRAAIKSAFDSGFDHARKEGVAIDSDYEDARDVTVERIEADPDYMDAARLQAEADALRSALTKIAEASPEPDDKKWYDPAWSEPYRFRDDDGAVCEAYVRDTSDLDHFGYQRGLHAAALIARAALNLDGPAATGTEG